MLTPRLPRLTASRTGFLARSTALSWPWNKDRILAPPGTMPPTFTDLALGLVDRSKPVIQVWCKDPLQREDDAGASPVVPAQAGTQGATTHAAAEPDALDPRFREDDDEDLGSAQNPLQRGRSAQLPLRPAGGRGEVGKPQAADAQVPHGHTRTTMSNDPLQREDDAGASPVVPAQAGTQGATTHAAAEPDALDPRFREDDDEDLGSAQNPLQRGRSAQLPLRPAGGRGEVGKPQAADAQVPHGHTRTTMSNDPLQREDDAGASPVVPAQAGTQGATTHSAAEPDALDPRFREDDDEDLGSAQNPLQPERPPQLPLRPPGDHASGGEGRGEVGKPQASDAQAPPRDHTRANTNNDPVHRERTGPLRNGNPRGNPNVAPRCGARTRRTGCPRRAPAMRNGRCRLHGGKSTGPRTEEGRARIRAARTRHGLYSAESRAFQRDISGLLRRNRELLALARQPGPVDPAALCHLLPPNFGKHPMQREARGIAASAGAIRLHPPMPGGPPATRQATAAAFAPVAPIHRPLLLARPRPLAT